MSIKITVKSTSVFQGLLGVLEKGNISHGNIPLNKLPTEMRICKDAYTKHIITTGD